MLRKLIKNLARASRRHCDCYWTKSAEVVRRVQCSDMCVEMMVCKAACRVCTLLCSDVLDPSTTELDIRQLVAISRILSISHELTIATEEGVPQSSHFVLNIETTVVPIQQQHLASSISPRHR